MSKKAARKTVKSASKAAGKRGAGRPAVNGAKKSAAPVKARGGRGGKASRATTRNGVARLSRGGATRHPTSAEAAAIASDAIARRASALVRFAHKMLADMAAGIPDERGTAQLPGAYNHKLWTLGHMADSNQWFAALIDGQAMTLPAEWNKLFGMGSTPADDAALYPPMDDARAAFEASVDRLCAAIEAHSDLDLHGAPAGDGAGFVMDKLDSALKAAWHYGWHLGQIAALRKGLGMPAMQGA